MKVTMIVKKLRSSFNYEIKLFLKHFPIFYNLYQPHLHNIAVCIKLSSITRETVNFGTQEYFEMKKWRNTKTHASVHSRIHNQEILTFMLLLRKFIFDCRVKNSHQPWFILCCRSIVICLSNAFLIYFFTYYST